MAFDNSQELIFKTLKDISETYCKKNSARVDQQAQWPQENIEALKASGLAGLLIPKEFGGHGQGFYAMARACEILGANCPSTSMCYGMHLVGSAVIAAKATPHHQENFLKPIAAGKHWTTLSLSESGTGSHFYIPQTKMIVKDKSLTLNGEKSFVTNGGHADSYVMSAVVPSKDASAGEFSCVIVPNKAKGLSWGQVWNGMGMRGNASRSVHLVDVEVPLENLLGSLGEQIWYVFEVVAPNFLIAMSGTYLGIATAALSEATEHLTKRRYGHSGATIASFQVLQHRIGVLWAQVERTRQLIYSSALQGDSGHPDALVSIMSAKAEVADCVVNVVNEAMTLMGGESYGYSTEMARHLRDARAAHVMSPTTDILRTWTGRALLGLPLLGD